MTRATSASPVLQINNLHLRRGATEILRGIDWTVQRGEHWVMMGPNGCGKTSLLKALLGYLTPSEGAMTLLGQRYGETDWRELRLQMGIVSSALHAHVPAAEPALETVISGRYAQLDFWGKATAADATAARRFLKQFDIPALADRPWAYLSQGERQRVLIARALMARPRLLILDEPCAGLDPVARAGFLANIEKIVRARHAPALVLVTHHVEEITPGFSHVLLLANGGVVAAGLRDQVLTDANLTKTFAAPVRLQKARRGLRLDVHEPL